MLEQGRNNTVVYVSRYHVVFYPKYQRKVLTPPLDERLRTILADQMERWLRPAGMHRLIKLLKGFSWHQLRGEFPTLRRRLPSLWTNSYYVATVGGVTRESLQSSIESQKDR
jgi:putative transposase